jgi:hypothetical protein
MKDRPKSITIISWFLIITGGISVISTALTYDNPEVVKMMELSVMPIIMQYIMMAIGLVITVTCGVLMLKGKGIGRITYVGWTIISLLIGVVTSPVKAMLIPGVVFFILITFFLFRPKANDYFSLVQDGSLNDS